MRLCDTKCDLVTGHMYQLALGLCFFQQRFTHFLCCGVFVISCNIVLLHSLLYLVSPARLCCSSFVAGFCTKYVIAVNTLLLPCNKEV